MHRHCLYHTEFGPTWQYDWTLLDGWTLANDLTRSWTIYDGFESSSANKTYHWWQIDQALVNPYLVPFWRLRRCFRTSDYFYFKFGLRRKCTVWKALDVTPSVFVEGGNARNFIRVFGPNAVGGDWGAGGASSLSFRLEASWRFDAWLTFFAYVEQYEVVGSDARDTNAASSYACAHNSWTHGGLGLRLRF